MNFDGMIDKTLAADWMSYRDLRKGGKIDGAVPDCRAEKPTVCYSWLRCRIRCE
jgi:hypothetical protein